MNRRDLQSLARIRLDEARLLLREKCFDGAYYLAGYAVECALKACIAKQTRRFDFPDKDLVLQSWSHKLLQLMDAARLMPQLEARIQADPQFALNWATVKDWKESSRYDRISPARATGLVSAITQRKHGVFRWLQLHW